MPHTHAIFQRHICRLNPVGNILQQQPQRAGIIQKRRITKSTGPDQIRLIRQRHRKPRQSRINKFRHHRSIGPGGLARCWHQGTHPADGLNFRHRGQQWRRDCHQSQSTLRPIQHRNQAMGNRHIQQFGQRRTALVKSRDLQPQRHCIACRARQHGAPMPVHPRCFWRSFNSGKRHLTPQNGLIIQTGQVAHLCCYRVAQLCRKGLAKGLRPIPVFV